MELDGFAFEENGHEEGQKIDFGRYLKALKRRWWLVLIIAVVVAIPWAIYVKQEKPVYEATTSIRFRQQTENPKAMMQDIYEQLTSRTFAEQVVRDLGLVVSIEQSSEGFLARNDLFSEFTSTKNPVPGEYFLRFSEDNKFHFGAIDSVDEETEITIRSDEVYRAVFDTISVRGFSFKLADPMKLPKAATFRIFTFRDAVKSLQERINVDLNRNWTLMNLKLQDNDPYVVTETVNSLARKFIEESQSIEEEVESTKLKMLREQVRRAKEDWDGIERRLVEAKKNIGIGGSEIYQTTIAQRDKTKQELNILTTQRDALKELIGRLKQAPSNEESNSGSAKRYIYSAIAQSKIFDNTSSMSVIRQRLDDLESKWEKEITIKTDQHPDVVALKNKIQELYSQISETADVKLNSLNNEIAKTERETTRLSAQIQQLPQKQSTLTELEREAERKSTYHQKLLSELQQAQIANDVAKSSIEILDPAIEPELPINRNKKVKAVAGGIVGLMLGIGLIVLLEVLDRTIKSVDDVKASMKLNILGTIPQIVYDEHFEHQDQEKAKMIDQQLVTHDYSPTPIGEAYRSLRTNILFSKSVGRVQSFVITSTAPGDGKSFTAANLSITMAQQKSNTLLIDTDLRRGVLHNTFGVSKEPGFSNYLTGAIHASEIINETHIPNLSLISCGSLIPNPSEMLGSVQLRRFLDEMRRRFDLIIFDTPPLNAATDAVVLGTQVDGTVVVVRAGKTKKDIARQKMELFQNVQAKLLGVVLNGTSVDLAHEGYSYYHY